MARLTPMSLDEAQHLGRACDLDVVAVEPIVHGSVNSNFALGLRGGGRAFLRVCEESARAQVEAQNALLAHLVACGVPTPAPLRRREGGTVGEHRSKPAVLFPFVPGAWLCQSRVTARHTARVGEVLATIHLAGEGFGGAPASRFGPEALEARLSSLRAGSLEPDLGADVERLSRELSSLTSEWASGETTVIHGDVFRDNVLWHDNALTAVLDFESASSGCPQYDLMVTVLAWCFGGDLSRPLARALVAGYTGVRPLGEAELAMCFDAGRRACVRFAVTRITDYELRPADVVARKDYRRFLQRLDRLLALGPSGLAAWLR